MTTSNTSSNHGRAVIVGLGTVSPIGMCVADLWESLFRSPGGPERQAIKGFPDARQSLRHAYAIGTQTLAAQQDDLSRLERFALYAIREALHDAHGWGIAGDDVVIGLALGTAAGDTAHCEEARLSGETARFDLFNPYLLCDTLLPYLTVDVNGPVFSVANACSAGLYALAHAVDLITEGYANAMIVVGVEILSRVTQASFQKMTALDADRCRPFDVLRNGTVLGEGAAALLLVSEPLAQRLGRSPYCRVAAYGMSCDAFHPTSPQPDGRDIYAAVSRALAGAECTPQSIAVVVPHGTGTPLNDKVESELLQKIFGDKVSRLHIMPIKAHIGHGAGASGAFSALAAAKALESHAIPPASYLEQADPELCLQFDREPSELNVGHEVHALVNAYAFGGNNISVVLEATHHG